MRKRENTRRGEKEKRRKGDNKISSTPFLLFSSSKN
jgi:hypothetical protein